METPSGFNLIRLGDVAEVFDGPHATPRKVDSGPWYLNIASLTNGRVDLRQSTHIHHDDVAKWTRRVQPQQGDTLFSYETRLGEAGYWDSAAPAVLGRRMGLLRPKPGRVIARYLTYAYLGEQFQEVLRKGTLYGVTVNRIPVGALPNWPILLPSIEEQQRIAGVLGAFDDLIETNLRLAVDLRTAISTSYELERRKADTIVPLSEVADHGPGKYLAKDEYRSGGAYPVFGSNSRMGTHSEAMYEGTMTVLARIGSNCGALHLHSGGAWINNNASIIQSHDARVAVRLHESLERVDMDLHRSGSGQPFIQTKSLMAEQIPWPSITPNSWDATAQTLLDAAADAETDAIFLKSRRDELLPLLVSGKVRVSEVEGSLP
ncbi:restriction endonuclease subunit S [uncultured Tessaracoccus sp.]|uniref:restriction endonuclease subunit S n=1 Tax=uncultured Tessaracoccus sp. TaxID=905023 RepID=UPI00260D7F54|nr:restriction endonuclease subunit S [uncultured Tessaracoccus sp.]